jgi:hypothetical protein
MKGNQTNPNSLHELAPLYALDALDSGEKQLFEAHLREGCAPCRTELLSLQDVTVGIASSVVADPPVQLRDRLMERVGRTPRMPGIAYNESGVLIARSQEINWRAVCRAKPISSTCRASASTT